MGKMSTMRQCDCGAYRLAKKVDGEWVWAAGCRACDKIARLYVLLDGGVKVTTGESPSRLRARAHRAEAEVESLKKQLRALEQEHNEAMQEAVFEDEECDCPYCQADRAHASKWAN